MVIQRTAKSEETKARIIEAAIKLFSEQGYAGTATSQIAKEANVAEGTIFKYFPKKMDLLKRTLIDFLDKRSTAMIIRPLDKLFEAYSDQPTEAFLKALIYDRMKLIEKIGPAIQVILTEMQYYEELRGIFKERVLKEGLAFGERVMDRFEEEGYRLKVPRMLAFRSFLGLIMTFILQRKFAPEVSIPVDVETEIDMIIQIFISGVMERGER